MKIFSSLLLLLSLTASADTILKYGGELPKSSEGLGATKGIFISRQETLYSFLYRECQVGYWSDGVGGGRKSSATFSYGLGVNVNSDTTFAQASISPAIITAPDSILGGVFQFENQVSIGLRDPKTFTTFGVGYTHFSSAGIESPNSGRDFLMFRLGIPW